jgi:translation initiation factor IF-3
VDLGKKLLLRFAQDLASHGQVEGQPKLEGRNAHLIISPAKKQEKPKEKSKADQAQQPPQV